MRCALIFNPASGRNRHLRTEKLRQIGDALSALGHTVELAATTGPGSATVQAQQAARVGAEIVFACGGDGTVHEVLQGLVSEAGQPVAALGVIPLGSANALARHLRLSLDPVTAALRQMQGKPRTIPVGKVTYGDQTRYFTVMAGAGPDGALVYSLLATQKSSLGRLAYYLHAGRLFVSRRFYPFEIEFTEAISGTTFIQRAVSVMAVRVDNLGGLFGRLAKRSAAIHDARLRLIVLRPPAVLSLPIWFTSGWLNLHNLNPFLRFVDVTAFTCRPSSGHPAHFQADGEWLGRIPMRVSIVPNGLRILLPSREPSPS